VFNFTLPARRPNHVEGARTSGSSSKPVQGLYINLLGHGDTHSSRNEVHPVFMLTCVAWPNEVVNRSVS